MSHTPWTTRLALAPVVALALLRGVGEFVMLQRWAWRERLVRGRR